ncbi:MAG: RnfABCDGE type electron transport complex subunit D, partial [Methylococcales bacterium]|nr:RnfABCDGE type electron transport complex subunit D [Methylococcales bacterium]
MIKVITKSSPFLHQDISVSVIMLKVLMALCPGILAMIYYLGWGVLINICLAIVVAVTAESLVMILRKRSITDTVTDYSAVITAVLLAIALPAYAPWWITVVGILFAIIIGKQLYGGLGYNPFNPAMLGYVALLISFPREMTQFVSPNEFSANINFVESFKLIFEVNNFPVDAFTMATPIDHLKTNLRLDHSMEAILQHSIYGIFGGTGWEIINACFFIGGLWLIYEKII